MKCHLADGHKDECGEGHNVTEKNTHTKWRQRQKNVIEQNSSKGDNYIRHGHVQCHGTTGEACLPVIGGDDETAIKVLKEIRHDLELENRQK